MQKRLIIIGAGGFGREVYTWAEHMIAAGADMAIGGFLDQNPAALAGFELPHTIIGDPETYQPRAGDFFTCAIGDPSLKLKLAESLQKRGAQFVSIIHPTAIVGPRCQFGVGAILCPYAILTGHLTLGDFVTVNVHSSIGHDAVLGDGVTLSGHADVTGAARLGRCVFLGSHAVVTPRVYVGDFARVGAGSVVVRDVDAGTTVMGVPARPVWTKAIEAAGSPMKELSHVGSDRSDRILSA